MTLIVALPAALDAPLRRIDARWKLAALVPAGAAVGALQTLMPAAAALAGALVVAWLARLSLRWYAARIGTVVLFLSLFLVFLPLADNGEETRWLVGPLSLSPRGLALAGVLLLKAVALATLLLAAATTAPVDVHLKALHSLRVPGLIVQLVALTLRYLAVTEDEFSRIRIALRVRGYRQRATPASLRTVSHVAGMLLVRASERADRVAQALRCRGHTGRYHALTEFKTHFRDVAFFAAVIGAAVGVLVWDLLGGY